MAQMNTNQGIKGFKPNTTLNLGQCPPTHIADLLPKTLHFPVNSGGIVVIHPAITNALVNQDK